MYFALALSIAASFWGARSAPLTCQPKVVVGTSADLVLPGVAPGVPAAMGAVAETCTIYISTYASAVRNMDHFQDGYCQQVVHEVGHLVGRPHSDDPASIMYGGPIDSGYAPWDCVHWRSYAKRHGLRVRR